MKKFLIMAFVILASAPAFAGVVSFNTLANWTFSTDVAPGGTITEGGFTLTLYGDAYISGGKLYLDGTGDYARLSSQTIVSSMDKLVIEAIVTPNALQGGGLGEPIPSIVDLGDSNDIAALGVTKQNDTSKGAFMGYINEGNCRLESNTDPEKYFLATQTHSAAAIAEHDDYNGGIYYTYQDKGGTSGLGYRQIDWSGEGWGWHAGTLTGDLYVGVNHNDTATGFYGTIDRVRISTYTGTWENADRSNLLGPSEGGGGGPAVAEPSALALIGLGMLGLVRRRK